LTWSERAGYQDLEDIEPITAAAYIEILQRQAVPLTVRQQGGSDSLRILLQITVSYLPSDAWIAKKGFCFSPPISFVVARVFSPVVREILVSSSVKPVIKAVSKRKVISFLVATLMVMAFLEEIILSEGDTSA
jgi:hypothetical protein